MAYLDRISATRTAPEILEQVIPLLREPIGNPQSPHRLGSRAAELLETARSRVAIMIGSGSGEIVFTSSGTESVNLALMGLARAAVRKSGERRRLLYSAVEHLSVKRTMEYLGREGFQAVELPVDAGGRLDRDVYRANLDDRVALVSIQMANPEVGTVQDLENLVPQAKEAGALFHTDAVAAAGWIPIDVGGLNVDALSLSGTMFHALPGSGALFLRRGVPYQPVVFGGIQERGRRPGTENIPAIVSLGLAAELAVSEMPGRMERGFDLAGHIRDGLKGIEALEFTGDPDARIPGHVSMLVKYVEGESLLLLLSMKGISAASGSSCTARDLKISPVLTAMGIDHTDAQGSLVLSCDRDTTFEDADAVIRELPTVITQLRAMSPIWNRERTKDAG
ncbi:cysteine desulfurase [bacterium]|nr:cysteine desulfurase [candidate division CSSED10-310 bacterium]